MTGAKPLSICEPERGRRAPAPRADDADGVR